MSYNPFKLVPEVSIFFVRDGKVLLLRRSGTGFRDGAYCLPCGHIEEGETMIEGAIREVQEEVGVTLRPEQLTFQHVMYRKDHDQRVSFYFVVTDWEGELQNMEPHKHDDMQWFSFDQLPEMMPFHQEAAVHYLNGAAFSEFGFPVS